MGFSLVFSVCAETNSDNATQQQHNLFPAAALLAGGS
jgi:hypothetical protein